MSFYVLLLQVTLRRAISIYLPSLDLTPICTFKSRVYMCSIVCRVSLSAATSFVMTLLLICSLFLCLLTCVTVPYWGCFGTFRCSYVVVVAFWKKYDAHKFVCYSWQVFDWTMCHKVAKYMRTLKLATRWDHEYSKWSHRTIAMATIH